MSNKVNIIIFHPFSFLGGADRSIARLINGLKEDKYNFYFISLNRPIIKKLLNKKIKFIKLNADKTIFSIFELRKILKKFKNKNTKNFLLSNQNFANIISILSSINLTNIKTILVERNHIKELSYGNSFFSLFKKKNNLYIDVLFI